MHYTGVLKISRCLAEFSVGSAITDDLEARQIHSSHHSFKRVTNRAIATSSAAHNARGTHHSDLTAPRAAAYVGRAYRQ